MSISVDVSHYQTFIQTHSTANNCACIAQRQDYPYLPALSIPLANLLHALARQWLQLYLHSPTPHTHAKAQSKGLDG